MMLFVCRLKTIADADLIIVLNDGKVVEQGNHRELMNIENGTYKGASSLIFLSWGSQNK
jgi:ABC-type transport system involved in Fe-S cluster assembly fused permease/ATPase subunit